VVGLYSNLEELQGLRSIEIEFGCGARLCIRGEVVPKTLRQVIELLR